MTKMWLFLPFSVYISLVLAVQSSFESLNFLQVCCQSSNLQFPLSCNHPPTPQENIWNFFPFCLPCYFADFWSGRRHLQKVYTLNGPGNYNFSSNFFNLNTEKGRNNHIFCHEHEYYFTIYTLLTKNDAYKHYFCI